MTKISIPCKIDIQKRVKKKWYGWLSWKKKFSVDLWKYQFNEPVPVSKYLTGPHIGTGVCYAFEPVREIIIRVHFSFFIWFTILSISFEQSMQWSQQYVDIILEYLKIITWIIFPCALSCKWQRTKKTLSCLSDVKKKVFG